MQGFRYSLRPLWLFWGVIEEESLFTEIKFLKTKDKLGVYPSLVLLSKNLFPHNLSKPWQQHFKDSVVLLQDNCVMQHMSEVCTGYVELYRWQSYSVAEK